MDPGFRRRDGEVALAGPALQRAKRRRNWYCSPSAIASAARTVKARGKETAMSSKRIIDGPLGSAMFDHKMKGLPGGISPLGLAEMGKQRWSVLREDLPLPLAVLKRSALDHNGRWMRDFLGLYGAKIAPHGKTTMSPQLFERQIADGAWAITVATVHQLQVARDFGFRRIVLANQLVGRQAIRYVFDELRRAPELDFYCLVDSEAGALKLAEAARQAAIGRPLQLLLEGGFAGGRTGARTLEAALAAARAAKAAAPFLALRGVEGFEGLFAGATPGETAGQVGDFLGFLIAIARAAEREELFAPGPVILSAGGSAFYDLVLKRFKAAGLERETMLLTRSGCYLTHDSAMYRRSFADLRERAPEIEGLGAGLRPALEVWAYVQSRPEPEKAILTMGKRDVSPDEPPVPLAWYRPGTEPMAPSPIPDGHVVTGLNDQHCHLRIPATSPLQFGDMVAFGISHPCLTFDKWQLIPVVDDAYVVVDAIRTFF
jgi:D-serine dehydratase